MTFICTPLAAFVFQFTELFSGLVRLIFTVGFRSRPNWNHMYLRYLLRRRAKYIFFCSAVVYQVRMQKKTTTTTLSENVGSRQYGRYIQMWYSGIGEREIEKYAIRLAIAGWPTNERYQIQCRNILLLLPPVLQLHTLRTSTTHLQIDRSQRGVNINNGMVEKNISTTD